MLCSVVLGGLENSQERLEVGRINEVTVCTSPQVPFGAEIF